MAKELIVSSTPHETKVAVFEEDQVVEVYFEREQEYSLAGSVYKGRVTRVLPGMQSAFVQIGLERDAFLYVSDFFEDTEEYDQVVSGAEDSVARMEGAVPDSAAAPPQPAAMQAAAGTGVPQGGTEAARPAEQQQQQQFDRQGPRGHRGHSRRRRGRGKGFPESKYAGQGPSNVSAFASPAPSSASAFASQTAPSASRAISPHSSPANESPEPTAAPPTFSAVVPAAESAVPHGAYETAPVSVVLPGESLAKYRNWTPPALTPAPLVLPEPLPEPAEAVSEGVAAETQRPTPEIAEELPQELESQVSDLEPQASIPEPGASSLEPLASEEELEASIPEPQASSLEPLASEEDVPPNGAAAIRDSAQPPRYAQPGRRQQRGRRGRRDQRPMGGPQARAAGEAAPARGNEARPTRGQPLIGELLKEGQEIIVQIAKEPIGKKGARITSHISLPGRYLVYMPTVDHVGISRRIGSDEERQRLKRVLTEYRRSVNMPGGFIVRTAAEGHTDEDLRADMRYLFNLWKEIRAGAERQSAPALLHRDLSLVERILRDQISQNFSSIWVDSETQYARIVEFVQLAQPSLVGSVKLYLKEIPIFEEFGVQEEINNSLKPKVWLKSGGYIVINQTEALVAIDVNTGKYVGKTQRLEDTIVKTNVDAIREIVRQIRLRDLGGIIVIDFIDMDERKNRQRVMQALEEALRKDRAPSKALAFNDFGLVAITRKRVKQPLEKALGCPCPYCEGSGFVKNVQTVSLEILAEAKKMLPALERSTITIRVNPEVAHYLKQPGITIVQEIEAMAKRPVHVKGEGSLHQEKFDIH